MEPTKFKELLLKIAVCAIACDGVVDEREIEAFTKLKKTLLTFLLWIYQNPSKNLLKRAQTDLNTFKKNVFDLLEANSLNIVQELTVLEISLRIITADEIEEDSEKTFVNELRSYLKLEDFLIVQRFGDISYLKPKKSEFKSNKSDDLDSISQKSK